jgi:hypothetical protein
MNAIKQFFADHKISAHTFAAAWAIADVLWYTNTDFHAYISGLLVALPAWLHALIFGVVVPVLVYLKATKKPAKDPNEQQSASKNFAAALLLFALLPLVTLTGCKTAAVSGQPTAPNLNTPYQKAAQAMSAFASDVQSAQQIVINLHKGGVIDKPTDTAIQLQFKQVAVYGKQIDALILAQASAVTIQARVNSALSTLSQITEETGKLDPNTLLQVQVSIQAIQQVLGTVLAAFNLTTAEVTYGPDYYRSFSGAGRIARVADLQPGQGSTGTRRYLASLIGPGSGSGLEVRSDLSDSGCRDSFCLRLAA